MNTLLANLQQPRRILILFALIAALWSRSHAPSNSRTEHNDLHQISLSAPIYNSSSRCVDYDDPPDSNNGTCECADPLTAANRTSNQNWLPYHQRSIQYIQSVKRDLDVVFLGDSIIEHWNGTGRLGTAPRPPTYRETFDRYFDSEQAPLKGLLLGTSGDTVVELLWHLQNGFLDLPTLQPSVWVLLIGTNDLKRWNCSKRTVVAAILNAAQYLHQQRPDATIILHGLLPRSEDSTNTTQLGEFWQDIQFINRELRKSVDLHPEWIYMDANAVFLKKTYRVFTNGAYRTFTCGGDKLGSATINTQYMPDGLHPNEEGYQQWAPLLVDAIVNRLPRSASVRRV